MNSLPDILCGNRTSNVYKTIKVINDFYNGSIINYGQLIWSNRISANLSDSFFHNLTFKRIMIGSNRKISSLQHINPNAFNGPISQTLEFLQIRSDKLQNDEDLYAAIRKLNNLQTLIVEGRFLKRIPAYSFSSDDKSNDMILPNLKSISFQEGKHETLIFLTEIEHHAFYNLPNLTMINLSGQDIHYIGDYAFALPISENLNTINNHRRLKINLSQQWNRNFTHESFSDKSFSQLNSGSVELDLSGNLFLKFLPENIFKEFLDSHPENQIRLEMKMKCHCGMSWLYFQKEKYQNQFILWSYLDDEHDNNVTFKQNYRIHCEENDDDLWRSDKSLFENCNNSHNLNVKKFEL